MIIRKTVPLAGLFLLLQLGSGAAVSAILFAHDGNDGCPNNNLYRIDTVLQSVTVVAAESGRCGPDVQLSPDGSVIYMAGQAGELRFLNRVTGLTSSTLALSNFPSPTDRVTAMEFVGSTLYVSLHEAGPESNPGVLATVNLATGVLTPIGDMTIMTRPTGGMHYLGGVMYAISSTNNNDSSLYTVNLATGAATLVAPITLATVQQESASGLAFGDGKMYLIRTDGDTMLYSINLTTGVLTAEFDLGVDVNSLTGPLAAEAPAAASIPTLSQWSMIALVTLLGIMAVGALRRKG